MINKLNYMVLFCPQPLSTMINLYYFSLSGNMQENQLSYKYDTSKWNV